MKLLLAMGALTVLSACGKTDDGRTVGQKLDSAVSSTEQAAKDAKNSAENSLNKVGNATKDAVQMTEVNSSNTGRVIGASVDDVAITASVSASLVKDADLSAIKIDVDTKNGVVLLTGPAPSAAARDRASSIAKSVKGVTSVENKLVVKGS